MTRVLVTGAAGFIGAHLTRRLARQGADLHVLVRPGKPPLRLADLAGRITVHEADLLDRRRLQAVAAAVRPDWIVHLAAPPFVSAGADDLRALFEGTVETTANLLDACAPVEYQAFVQAGDVFEYGPAPGPRREDDPCRPETPYAVARLAATSFALSAATRDARPVVVLRLVSTYGAGNHPERLIPKLVAGCLSGEPVLLSRPEVARDWVHVDDVVEAILAACHGAPRAGGKVINVGTGRSTSIGHLVALLGRLRGRPLEARWGAFAPTPYDDGEWVVDPSRAEDLLGWRSAISLEQGLRRTLEASL